MQHKSYETNGPVATLTFNRPEARQTRYRWRCTNAPVTRPCERVDATPRVRVLVFCGAGGKLWSPHRPRPTVSEVQETVNMDGKYEEAARSRCLESPRACDEADYRAGRRRAAGGGSPSGPSPWRSARGPTPACDVRDSQSPRRFGHLSLPAPPTARTARRDGAGRPVPRTGLYRVSSAAPKCTRLRHRHRLGPRPAEIEGDGARGFAGLRLPKRAG